MWPSEIKAATLEPYRGFSMGIARIRDYEAESREEFLQYVRPILDPDNLDEVIGVLLATSGVIWWATRSDPEDGDTTPVADSTQRSDKPRARDGATEEDAPGAELRGEDAPSTKEEE